jgi:hypothetical protein
MTAGPSRYSADFVAEVRAAQRARCERLDAQARAWCEEAAYFRRRLRAEGEKLAAPERTLLARRALQRRYMLIYRTLADPRALDPTLDPSSARSARSSRSAGTRVRQLRRGHRPRDERPRWLSTWSGLSSNAALERTLPEVRVPTLVVNALADTDILPSEARRALAASAADDKTLVELSGAEHYLRPVGGDDPRARLARSTWCPGSARAGPYEQRSRRPRPLGDAHHRRRLGRRRRPRCVPRHASRRHGGARRLGAAGGQRDAQRDGRRPPDGGVVSTSGGTTSRRIARACWEPSEHRPLFLVSYVVYHARAASVPFAGQGWIRPVYFFILITHIVLATVIVPARADDDLPRAARRALAPQAHRTRDAADLALRVGDRRARLPDAAPALSHAVSFPALPSERSTRPVAIIHQKSTMPGSASTVVSQ